MDDDLVLDIPTSNHTPWCPVVPKPAVAPAMPSLGDQCCHDQRGITGAPKGCNLHVVVSRCVGVTACCRT